MIVHSSRQGTLGALPGPGSASIVDIRHSARSFTDCFFSFFDISSVHQLSLGSDDSIILWHGQVELAFGLIVPLTLFE